MEYTPIRRVYAVIGFIEVWGTILFAVLFPNQLIDLIIKIIQ